MTGSVISLIHVSVVLFITCSVDNPLGPYVPVNHCTDPPSFLTPCMKLDCLSEEGYIFKYHLIEIENLIINYISYKQYAKTILARTYLGWVLFVFLFLPNIVPLMQ